MVDELPNSEVQTTSTETPSELPPIETPPAPPAPVSIAPDRSIVEAYNGILRDKDQELARTRARLEELEAARNAPPPKTPEENAAEYFANPVEVIQREIQRAIAPLNASARQMTRDQNYAKLKQEMKLDSRFSDLDKIETEFDQLMSSVAEPEPQGMIAAYWAAYGMASKAGKLNPAPVTTPTPQTPAAPVVTPPHLRPSGGNAPAPVANKNLRPLTENEETVRRLNGMTHEEYLKEFDTAGPLRVGGK